MYTIIAIVQIIWFIVPAGAANSGAALSARMFPHFTASVDGGKNFLGKRIFGSHKTWRGLIVGTLVGGVIFAIQKILFEQYFFAEAISFLDYARLGWEVGFIFGFGAVIGDLVHSFFKRRIGVAPGKPWLFFDQVDWVVGSLVFISPFVHILPRVFLVSVIIGMVLHFGVRFIAYHLGFAKMPV